MFAAENESFYISYRCFANAETRAPVIEYRKGQISERPKQIELEHFEKRMGDLRKIILCRKRPFHTPGEQIARRHEETGHGAVDKIQIHRIERSGAKKIPRRRMYRDDHIRPEELADVYCQAVALLRVYILHFHCPPCLSSI